MNQDYQRIYMQYIGACALLGRISGSRLTDDENVSIHQALTDLATMFPQRFAIWQTSGGGCSLEPKPL